MTPDNGFYAQAAYVAASVIYLVYAAGIWRRRREIDRRRRALSSGAATGGGRGESAR